LQLTEIEVFAEGLANVALGAATASTQPLWPPGGWTTAQLVNGNLTDQIHADAASAVPYAYTLNLGTAADISYIKIHARKDGCCPERLSNYRVSIHEDN